MNKKQLLEFRAEVERAIAERNSLGDFDANSKYMRFLLGNMKHLIQHAIDTYPKGQKIEHPNPKDAKTNTRVSHRSPKHGR